MGLIDWIIVVIPVAFVLSMGFYARKYIRGVSDYLAAGRVCGRYVICVGDVANALSIIGLVAYVEVHYKTGFALAFWNNTLAPLGIIVGLFGYCVYRFRETKAMSMGQFLEMRYSRSLRIFAAVLRSTSEILANMIMPAVAARFFIYFLDLPKTFSLFGVNNIPTFMIVIIICLIISISLICMGGTLALVITDAVQGMIFFPIIAIFVIFILSNFSWAQEIIPVMTDRVQGESFINPYDLSKLRDFNLFFVLIVAVNMFFHRASWIGGGTSSAAKSPHEQKMASILGKWRVTITRIFYVMIAITIITLLNHRNWAPEAKDIRDKISRKVSAELIPDVSKRKEFDKRIQAVPAQYHQIGVDKPLSQTNNLDTPMLNTAHKTLQELEGDEYKGNAKFQQYRTLFHQLMLGSAMREMLPVGLVGAFCLLMILAMISTDDTRIYSSTVTITQDVIMPLRKKSFTPKQHVLVLRLVAIGIGIFFFCGSYFMAQIDYIELFITLMTSMWLGGCGPVMIFGLYSRRGTTAGAFASLIAGMGLAFTSIIVKRNWAESIYPWLEETNMVEPIGSLLTTVSAPFNPLIIWKMDPVKFPINSYEIFFMIMLISLALYWGISYLTLKKPFNLERMLHRGIYNIDGENKEQIKWSFKTVISKMLGITKEYSKGDRFIAKAFFIYAFVYNFLFAFLGVIIWNAFAPWPIEYWSWYFLIVLVMVPGLLAFISTFWFGIGGFIDLMRLFRDLEKRVVNNLDNGRVEGHVSLSDKAEFEKVEHETEDSDSESSK
jgi:solute:Na+ symporter, SSS family